MSGGDRSSTQGSNVSKPGGWRGWMQQERFWGAGVWLLFRALHQDSLKRLPRGPIGHGPQALRSDWSPRAGRCWSCSRGFRRFQHIILTPRDHLTAPAALKHSPSRPGAPLAHNTHTHTHDTRSNASQRRRHAQQCFIIKGEHGGFPLNRVCY